MSLRGGLNAALAEVPGAARAEEGWIFGLSPGGQSG